MSSNVVDNNAQEWSARDFERVTTELPTLGRGNDDADDLGQSCLLTEPALQPPPLLTQLESSFDLDETAGICIGQELCARYVVRRLLGVGGMGAVFAAFDELRQSEVAIKVMHPDLLQTPTALERFQQEALLASNLGHPNIVRVYGPERDGESRFLVMEILDGRTLREEMDRRIEANSPFSWTEALAIVEPLCEALAYAHRSTVHRDIKPDNVMLCNDGTVKLMDFGLARPSDSELTRTAQLVGSFNYMSPEQRQGRRDLGARSDQYSVAVLLYELLTASLPMAPYSSVRELRRDVSRKVSAAIDRALSNAPAARFEDMQSFLAALRQQVRRQAANLSWLQAPILLLISTIVLAWGGISLANWHVQKVEQAEPSALSQSLTASWLSAGQRRLPSSAPSLPEEASTPLASATEQEPARPALSAPPASSSLADSEGLDAASLSTEAPMPELDPTWLVEEQAMAAEPMSVAVRNVYTARRL
ncbi:MAG: serine/threonine-protein kinase, partial [Myxococcota bacterium]|nr:serine/threonine-protein kinase [Myxococcota bacterium]